MAVAHDHNAAAAAHHGVALLADTWTVERFTPGSVTVVTSGDNAAVFCGERPVQSGSLELPAQWIAHNSTRARHASGQRHETISQWLARRAEITSGKVTIVAAAACRELNAVSVSWSDGVTDAILFDHLCKYAARPTLRSLPSQFSSSGSGGSGAPAADAAGPSKDELRTVCASKTSLLRGAAAIQRVAYDSLSVGALVTDAAAHQDKDLAMLALYRDGIVIVEACPKQPESVMRLADFFGAPAGAIHTLYGRSFMVEAAPAHGPKNNIAYTGVHLDLHNDLVYYQSMPGLQLLHCMDFDDAVKGGDSFFADAFAAANRVREQNPRAFDVLCRVPAAFMKDDAAREIPALYYYAAPHIQLCPATGEVVCVRWAPAFEAPLPLLGHTSRSRGGGDRTEAPPPPRPPPCTTTAGDLDIVNKYFDAYAVLAAAIDTVREEQALKMRLRPGECVVFNQARLLHGRDAFSEPQPGMRRLHGCYVNIDDFRSRCMSRFAFTLPRGIRTPNWTFANGSSR